MEQEETNEQEKKENVWEERTTDKSAVDKSLQDPSLFVCDLLKVVADEPTEEESRMIIAGE
jgi:hypothetical protein